MNERKSFIPFLLVKTFKWLKTICLLTLLKVFLHTNKTKNTYYLLNCDKIMICIWFVDQSFKTLSSFEKTLFLDFVLFMHSTSILPAFLVFYFFLTFAMTFDTLFKETRLFLATNFLLFFFFASFYYFYLSFLILLTLKSSCSIKF